MKKLFTFIAITALFGLGESRAQFNLDWSEEYSHTTSANFSAEGRRVLYDTLNGVIFTMIDVTSDKDPNGVVTGQTYSYTVLNKYDLTGALNQSVLINVSQHAATGFDLKSGFGFELDATGNVFVGYMNHDAASGYDVNIAKYTNQLNLVWTYKFNAATDDIGITMKISSQGNAFAILKSSSGSINRHRIIKATSAGITTTALYTYSNQPDFLLDMAVDGNQNVYTTGYRHINNVKMILVSCVTNTGTLLWSRTDNCGTATGDDFARDINYAADGYLYITGSSQGTVQHGIDAVVMKFNPVNGKKIWENFINFNLTDGGFFIINPDPYYAYVCWVAGSAVYVEQISAFMGNSIRRVSYTPSPVSGFSSLGTMTVSEMQISKNQNIYLTGSIAGVNAGYNFLSSYLVRISFTGRGVPQVQYTIPVTGTQSNSSRGISFAFDEDNNQVYYLEDAISTLTSHQYEKTWLNSYDLMAGLRLQNPAAATAEMAFRVSTYPNPVTDQLNITADQAISSVAITDLNGRLLKLQDGNGQLMVTSMVSDLAPGIYLLTITNETGQTSITRFSK